MHNIFERLAYYLIHVYNDIKCASYLYILLNCEKTKMSLHSFIYQSMTVLSTSGPIVC